MRELAVGGSILTKKYYSFENQVVFTLYCFNFSMKRDSFLASMSSILVCTYVQPLLSFQGYQKHPFEIYDPKYGYLMTKLGVPSNRRTTNSPKRHLKISSSILFLFLNISDNIYVLIIQYRNEFRVDIVVWFL